MKKAEPVEMAVDCHRCEYYYVTWEERTPHGCRAMGFKSRRLPSLVVRETTPGMDCLKFKRKVLAGKKAPRA